MLPLLQTNKLQIMSNKQFIYSSAIIVLGFFQTAPAFLMLASTNIAIILLGIFWSVLLASVWSSTIIKLKDYETDRIT